MATRLQRESHQLFIKPEMRSLRHDRPKWRIAAHYAPVTMKLRSVPLCLASSPYAGRAADQ